MYHASVSQNLDIVDALIELAPRLPDESAQYFSSIVLPAVQHEIVEILSPYPGPVVTPFEFATARSRRWYFANHPDPYQRTGDLGRAWKASMDRRGRLSFITIDNREPYAGYVYGPGNPLASFRQVPGHRNTGWGKDFDEKMIRVEDFTTNQLLNAWDVIVAKVLKLQ